MSLTALSIAAIPAATGLARDMAQAGERIGSGFLSVLSNMAGSAGQSGATGEAATELAAAAEGGENFSTSLASKTTSWSERFMNWLNLQRSTGDLEIKLSLDALDQPQVKVSGEGAEEISAVIAQNPAWLQEFRELALDRVAEQGQPPPGAPPAAAPTLSISQHGDQLTTSW